MSTKDDTITMEGKILELRPNTIFLVKLENDSEVICHISGRIRQKKIKIIVGDRVKVELSVYDLTKGRITYRCD